MPAIDVSAEIEIAAAPADVAAVMFDPSREPEWLSAVTSVNLIDAALVVGARVRHVSQVFGMDTSWTSQVTAVHFPHKLTMQIAEGPFAGVMDYSIARTAGGALARVRNTGDLATPMPLPGSMVSKELLSALTADLARLKALVEQA